MAKKKAPRKDRLTYYFSVEGETEQWYLEWLAAQINEAEGAKYKVSFKAEVQKDPVSYAKKLTIQDRTVVWHLSDIEGTTQEHIQGVKNTMGRLNDVKKLKKQIAYKWGYSNLSFDLWMVLHKQNCNGSLSSVDGYLSHINRAYSAHFESMKKYKEEANFKYCLSQLKLEDVISALQRAKTIMQRNQQDGYPLTTHQGYKFYEHNPSLELWQPIEKVLSDCKLL